ncbi:5'-nucleotidase C-terminal domain-containing protein [bacterium]|nr:5'-nucleotidase C-terminal domain-containing protein [bacterium]
MSLTIKRNHAIATLLASIILLLCNSLYAKELTILYWGDRFSRNLPYQGTIDNNTYKFGGAGTLSAMVKTIKKDNLSCLTLVAGGEFSGAPISPLTNGASQVEILNAIGINGFVPGIHEFDYGWESLRTVMKEADFPVYLANVIVRDNFQPMFVPDTIIYLPGIMVGMCGLIDPDFKNSQNLEGVLGIEASDAITEARAFIKRRQAECDLMIVLSSLGWSNDSLLAANVNGIDVIIGSGSDYPYDPPRKINNVIIACAGSLGRWLGRLALDVDTLGNGVNMYRNDIILLDTATVPPDEKVDKLARKLEKKHTKILEREIGRLQTDWNHEVNKPCNLAQWTADAMRTYIMDAVTSRVHLSVVNNGSLQRGQQRGILLERDIWEICPYDYPIMIFQLSGEELLNIVKRQIKSKGEFLTWSGLRFKVSGNKIEEFYVGQQKVSPMDEYSVVSTGYIWQHFEEYFGIERGERPLFYPPDANQRSVMINAVEKQKIITAPLDDRWEIK